MISKKYLLFLVGVLAASHGMYGAGLGAKTESKTLSDRKQRAKQQVELMFAELDSLIEAGSEKAEPRMNEILEKFQKFEKQQKILRGFIAMGIELTQSEKEKILGGSTRQKTFSEGILDDSGSAAGLSPSAAGIGLLPVPAHGSHDERELKRLAEWEADIESLDTSTMESVLAENMSSDRPSHIQRLIKQWEKTPGKDEYDFETDAEAEAACLRLPRYLILEGVPGTGKSILARAIAQKCNMRIFSKGASLIADSYVHSGEVDLKNVFAHASAWGKKCAIIIDEIDSIFSHHNKRTERPDHDAGTTRTLWTLLDKYEKKPILFIGTTNDISTVPSPIRSRFEGDHILRISPIASKERLEKLTHYYMRSLGCIENSPVVKDVAAKTLGFSQRRVKRVVEMALNRYFDLKKEKRDEKALEDCFLKAFESLKASDQLYDPEKPFGDRVCDFTAKYGPTVAMAVNVGGLGVSAYNAYRSEQNRAEDLRDRKLDRDRQDKMHKENLEGPDFGKQFTRSFVSGAGYASGGLAVTGVVALGAAAKAYLLAP